MLTIKFIVPDYMLWRQEKSPYEIVFGFIKGPLRLFNGRFGKKAGLFHYHGLI